eukprot:TRINITY_DN61661_c0_g1_i1.p2 TRINITY_DN61661_c0_g1~~TRINITY_DN61661_c0_g1_i1.p2  ORF type:complete len:489 (-),score=70.06 TRINITY_DN61661_c0_g1_i1:1787-3193(-)
MSNEEAIARAKSNLKFPDIEQRVKDLHCEEVYQEVLDAVARNVKMGPWKATSGIEVPYYLNSSTNFLDKMAAPKIVDLFVKIMPQWLPKIDGLYLICGPEVAGGMIAAQLASAGTTLNEICDYVYVRKEQKKTGTCQQLEGPQKYTARTPESPEMKGIWVDDCNSTGGSLREGVLLMKEKYNVTITHALYLVDRTKDRANLPDDRQKLADPAVRNVDIKALYDLQQVDDYINTYLKVEKAKRNVRFPNIHQMMNELGCSDMYKKVLGGIVDNVKMGPFTATSGISIPYYLNSATNFMDKDMAPLIRQLFTKVLLHWLPKNDQLYLICGPEVAGGMLACQLGAANGDLDKICDYVYVRKEPKTTGTCQQLEGPQVYTSRKPISPEIKAIWVDDCNSTGGSLVEGVRVLKEGYNIVVTHALYLVDRTKDRQNLPPEKQRLNDPLVANVDIKALYDLDQVDQLMESRKAAK